MFGPPFVVSVEAITGSPFDTYDLKQSLPLTSGGLSVADAVFQTSGGDLELKSITALSFEASVVAEGSTWAMLALGFAGLGLVAYRRRPVAIAA